MQYALFFVYLGLVVCVSSYAGDLSFYFHHPFPTTLPHRAKSKKKKVGKKRRRSRGLFDRLLIRTIDSFIAYVSDPLRAFLSSVKSSYSFIF